LDLASIDFQTGVSQQVLAGRLIAASQGGRAAHPASHPGRVTVHQAQGRIQGKASLLALGTVEISSAKGDPTQCQQDGLGTLTEVFLVGSGLVVWAGQSGVVEQFFQPASAVVLERRQQSGFQCGKIGDTLGGQTVQTERGLREEGRQKRWNFFLTPAACCSQVSCSVSRA